MAKPLYQSWFAFQEENIQTQAQHHVFDLLQFSLEKMNREFLSSIQWRHVSEYARNVFL